MPLDALAEEVVGNFLIHVEVSWVGQAQNFIYSLVCLTLCWTHGRQAADSACDMVRLLSVEDLVQSSTPSQHVHGPDRVV